MLFEAHPEIDIHEMSPLALAFAGDAVLELLVRQRLVETSRLQPGRLHSVATHYVSAHAQNQELALIEPMLTEEEQNNFAPRQKYQQSQRGQACHRAGIPRLHRL